MSQSAMSTGMPCPRCHVDLVMSERQGIEIDYCPKCRGVWLDRGELDKIIERSERFTPAPQPAPPPAASPAPSPPWGHGDRDESRGRHGKDDRRKKGGYRSFLGELFD
jgi:Zn-finger nucleic acid-binding protein